MIHDCPSTGAPRRALRLSLVLILLGLALAPAQASVILNAADASSGFYNGFTYDFGDIPSNVPFAPLFTAALPSVDGFAGQKMWGTATLDDNNGYGPYFWGSASGTASGTLAVDTYLAVNWTFTSPNLPDVAWSVSAAIDTSNGTYYGEFSFPGSVSGNTSSGTSYLEKSGGSTLVPAGTTINAWLMQVFLGSYGSPGGQGPITIDIPQNSIDLVGVANSSTAPSPGAVPEPSTWMMAGAGFLLIALRGRRR